MYDAPEGKHEVDAQRAASASAEPKLLHTDFGGTHAATVRLIEPLYWSSGYVYLCCFHPAMLSLIVRLYKDRNADPDLCACTPTPTRLPQALISLLCGTCPFAQISRKIIKIPTYGIGPLNRNPMFLEKRVYQGSSGKVYPHPVVDSIDGDKQAREWNAVVLENEFIQVMVLPELGGRIQMAHDKTNGYDFVYHNKVIKPALVGLAGPWISGGIEFNYPQHHRPNTYGPVDSTITTNPDGSVTCHCSELDRMQRMRGTHSITLRPGSSVIEISARLNNRSDDRQSFLWWANPAFSVDEHHQSMFPPDVTAVMDHGKRDVSAFPLTSGTYYKVDYSNGPGGSTDISRYCNVPVPTSYMAYYSDYNYVGAYDHGKEAGLLHVANRHVSPGKK